MTKYNDLFKTLTETDEFNRESQRIAGFKHEPLDKVKSMMLSWLFFKVGMYQRNNPDKNVYRVVNDKNSLDYKYFMNYTVYNASHDVIRELSYVRDHVKIGHDGSYVRIKQLSYDDEINSGQAEVGRIKFNIDDLIRVTYLCLQHRTAEFACYLILNGAEETMDQYNYSMRQLNQRITNIAKVMKEERKNKPYLFPSFRIKSVEKSLYILTQFTDLLESPDYTDQKMSELIRKYQDRDIIVNALSDNYSFVNYSIDNFGKNGVQDYQFINRIYEEKNHIEDMIYHDFAA